MSKLEISDNKTKDKEYNLPCQSCSGETVHKVLSSINVEGHEDIEQDFWIKYWEDYEIVQCQGCRSITFRKSNRNTEDIIHYRTGSGGFEEELVDHIDLYPNRIPGRQKLKQTFIIPYEVRRIYDETHEAVSNNLQILATIGIRALVEAICEEKSATGRNLQNKIDSLNRLGLLTQESANILHSIRLLGNVAAHQVEPPNQEIINAAFDIVENVLYNVYVIPEIAKKLDT